MYTVRKKAPKYIVYITYTGNRNHGENWFFGATQTEAAAEYMMYQYGFRPNQDYDFHMCEYAEMEKFNLHNIPSNVKNPFPFQH